MKFRISHRARLGAVFALARLCGACSASDDSACTATFPDAPAGASGAVYVATGCDGDGSREKPFGRIQQGVDAAASGNAVLVGAGTYPENVRISTEGLQLVGSSATSDPDAAGIIIQAPDPDAIVISDAKDVRILGVGVSGALGVGLWARQAGVVVQGSRIESTVAGPEGLGYGIVASSGASIELRDSVVLDSFSVGVLVAGAHGIIIQNRIDRNGAGGVRVESADAAVTVKDNTLDANAEVGVGFFSSSGSVEKNQIHATALGEVAGDGVIVASLAGGGAASDVEVRENTIDASGRVGVLFGAEALGIIIQNVASTNGSAEAGIGAGVWVQGKPGVATGLEVSGNELTENLFVGMALTAGARGIIIQNTAKGTRAGSVPSGIDVVEVGDGLGIFAGASASVTQANVFENNFRAGILVSDADAAATSISGNTVSTNDHGIIIQNEGAASVDVSDGGNTVQGNVSGDLVEHVVDQFVIRDDALGEPAAGSGPPN